MEIFIENIQDKIEITDEILELMEKAIKNEVSIILTDNEKIREINYEQRNIDKPTDVLSFVILISMEKAKEQSMEYGHSFERELIFLLTHGVFHLLGYDHDTPEREKKNLERN